MTDPTTTQVGSSILTRGGTYFDYLLPEYSVITPEDIASGLANTCRFSGQCTTFYSVAQHCVLASYVVPEGLAFEALMHDAAEAYIGDIPTPLKQFLPDFLVVEKRVENAIAERFRLPFFMPPEIKLADRRMLRTEREDLMPPAVDETPWLWLAAYPRSQVEPITPWTANYARAAWLDRFNELWGGA